MRITAAQRAENENRIRTVMDRLLRGENPPGGRCDIKTLAIEAGMDRTAFYGTRPYSHLREEFERRLQILQQAGEVTDPREAQITRLKAEVTAPGSPPNTTRSSTCAAPPTRPAASPVSQPPAAPPPSDHAADSADRPLLEQCSDVCGSAPGGHAEDIPSRRDRPATPVSGHARPG
jgi:hypothetical protein